MDTRMLENTEVEDRFIILLSYLPRIVGRIALIAAFVLAIGGELRGAVASLALALWMMWSALNLVTGMMIKDLDSLSESQEDIKSDLLEIQKNTDSLDEDE